MAKGRKLLTSRSERLLTSYSYGQGQSTAIDSLELGEDDVWSIVDDVASTGDDHPGEWIPRATADSNGTASIKTRRPLPPRDGRHLGGLSLAFEDSDKRAPSRIVHQFRSHDRAASPRGHHLATSAPVNVPDWSKVYRVDSVESLPDSDHGAGDEDSEIVPPHVYLAREYREMAAKSVFEGVGRTLKGRDMSRVRDAVWSQTGFDG
ncbi:uncharacterized protein LOC127793931 [Diospyros lotus]|uniref:uncharacterized protein LOC127793931 n=1 Tax=Diospyros lotus TaxID=55363 RepID=UPI00225C34C9|nr:uncharacterized protein LOC127793931 [Diospyros lotus]